MNERIRELAEQAGVYTELLNESENIILEKFAELIVRECAGVASNQVMDVEGNDWGVSWAVKKYFGVQE